MDSDKVKTLLDIIHGTIRLPGAEAIHEQALMELEQINGEVAVTLADVKAKAVVEAEAKANAEKAERIEAAAAEKDKTDNQSRPQPHRAQPQNLTSGSDRRA